MIFNQYETLLRDVYESGTEKSDRTGVGTRSVFGRQIRYDLREGFPLVTTKRVYWKVVIRELLWIISGDTNILPLVRQGVSIWSDWPHDAYKRATGEDISLKDFEQRILSDEGFAAVWGNLGPVYGKQWRYWEQGDQVVDQLAEMINLIRTNPDSRRIILSAWNPAQLRIMALPPCHMQFQAYVCNGALSLQMYMRSADIFLGVPFNIASYAALTMMLAQICGLEPGELVISFGDLHIYSNHLGQVEEQLSRDPRPYPQLILNPVRTEIDDFVFGDFDVIGYDPHPPIQGDVAV